MGVPGQPEKERRYSDKELALILKLATDLDGVTDAGSGHTLAEIQSIAAEAGIDPDLVVRAAASLASESGRGTTAFLGAPTTYRFQRHVEGELPESELGEIVRAIRRLTGEEGEVTQVLDALEWRHERFEGAVTHIAISRRRGRTMIEVTRRFANNAGWLYAAAASVVAGTEIQAALALELGVLSGLWGSAYVGARALWKRIARRGRRDTQELAESLTRQIGEAVRQLAPAADRNPSGARPEAAR